MYPTDNRNGPLKLNQFVTKNIDSNIMLKTIQNLYNKTNAPFNMTSPFLVDNILHHQKTAIHNQYLNQQIENYVLNRQYNEQSRENSPETEDSKMAENDDETNRPEEVVEDSKIEDEDSKSRDDDETFVKNEQVFYNNDFYRSEDNLNREKEVLNIPNFNRCSGCGAFDCPPFSCKKSGIRRLEELEKRFNLNYQETSGDEGDGKDGKAFTDDIVRCEEYNAEQKKPLLKFSVSAILGDREDKSVKNHNVNGKWLSSSS